MAAVILALSLVACGGGLLVIDPGDTDSDAVDTDPIVEDPPPTEDPVAVLVFEATLGPPLWMAWGRALVASGGCPSAEPAGATDWTLTGGCADAEGRAWSGSGTFRRTAEGERLDFGDLSWAAGDGGGALSGQILWMNDVLTADHVLRDEAGSLRWAHDGHTASPGAVAIADDGEWDVAGRMTVAGLGAVDVIGVLTRGGACAREPDAGDLEVSGPVTLDVDFDGAEVCDGCVPYSGGSSGSACAF